jgi:hypothetical protein
MSAVNVQGTGVVFTISTDSGSTWKTLVCEKTQSIDYSANVNSESTKCAEFASVDDATFKISGSGVCNATPTSSEVSTNAINGYLKAKTSVMFKVQNPVDSANTVTAGAAFFYSGSGYFTSIKINSNDGEIVKFDYSFQASGDIDVSA